MRKPVPAVDFHSDSLQRTRYVKWEYKSLEGMERVKTILLIGQKTRTPQDKLTYFESSKC